MVRATWFPNFITWINESFSFCRRVEMESKEEKIIRITRTKNWKENINCIFMSVMKKKKSFRLQSKVLFFANFKVFEHTLFKVFRLLFYVNSGFLFILIFYVHSQELFSHVTVDIEIFPKKISFMRKFCEKIPFLYFSPRNIHLIKFMVIN